ncbi:MAG: YidC/Oxa1 family insertase periplasmic-domain containing protein [Planctomycetes bacterium]|nr:YidC/Oxa1 family insertase periplasmic-domain containing protein [Planctomycetota bacterium]
MPRNQPSQFQRILTALAASILVFYLWLFIYQKFWVKPAAPRTQPATTATFPASEPAIDGRPTAATAPSTARAEALDRPAPDARSLVAVGGQDTTVVRLGDAAKGNPFPMALELTPRGAAVRSAWLRDHYETVEKLQPYAVVHPLIEGDRENASLETPWIRFVDLNQEVRLDAVVWRKETVSDEEVSFSVQINAADGSPVARAIKTYTLRRQPAPSKGSAGQTFDVLLDTTVENLSGGPLRIVLVQQGPVGFRQAYLKTEDRAVVVAMYEKGREKQGPAAKSHQRSELADKESLELGRDEDGRRVAWVAEANQYFTCIVAPADRTGPDSPVRFERVDATHLTDRKDGHSEDLTFRYVTTPIAIAAGGRQDFAFECYVGPKSKTVFQSVEQYASRNYYAVITASFYACAPTALVGLMMRLLNFFYLIPPNNYGIAIFLLVILVRAILHPITKKSQVNMMKMQKQMGALQPKINAVKEKYANDRAAMNQAMMEVYREAGINPAGNVLTCIPMLLQLPIWAALWTALNSIIEMRHAPLDGWWIKDLTQPDALVPLPVSFSIPLISSLMGGPITAVNLLPILLGISQLLQAKYMPHSSTPSTSNNPNQMEQQRKMMMFMSVFFLFMFYNMPSGLNLYIMTSNLAGIIEQWRIRQHLADYEEKQKTAPPATPRGKSWLQRKWENLQKEVEDAKRLQTDKSRKRR